MNDVKTISVHRLSDKIKQKEDFILLDVREDSEVQISKISGSLHVPMNEIADNIFKLDNSQDIVVMCKSGVRSYNACQYLMQNGFDKVYNLEGGIINWVLEIDSNMKI